MMTDDDDNDGNLNCSHSFKIFSNECHTIKLSFFVASDIRLLKSGMLCHTVCVCRLSGVH